MTDTSTDPTTQEYAAALDAADPLAPFRERFVGAETDLVYFDGNSLGPPAVARRADRLADVRRRRSGAGASSGAGTSAGWTCR